MNQLHLLTEEEIVEAHNKYREVGSLKQTSLWLKKQGTVINRHNLARLFHERDLYVAPPNGRAEKHYTFDRYMDEHNKMVAEAVKITWEDILNYPRSSRMDYLSACNFVCSDRYLSFLERLKANCQFPENWEEQVASGVNREDILKARDIYNKLAGKWVYDIGD